MWRRALWIAGGLWLYSWSVICLEIFRWHYMTASFALNPPPQPPGLGTWMVVVVAGVVWLVGWLVYVTVHQPPNRMRPGLCPKCGYDLRATPGRCPECGMPNATRS